MYFVEVENMWMDPLWQIECDTIVTSPLNAMLLTQHKNISNAIQRQKRDIAENITTGQTSQAITFFTSLIILTKVFEQNAQKYFI